MSLRILVTDRAHSLGRMIEQELEKEHCQFIHAELNWSDPSQVLRFIQSNKVDLIINTCGWEPLPSEDDLVLLGTTAKVVADACAQAKVPLLQFSSYQVFGPDKKASHNEKDIPAPISAIGQAFFAAEQAVEHSQAKAVLLRLGWVIDSDGNNLLTQILEGLTSGNRVPLNTRLRGAPTPLTDVARVVIALVKQIASGAENWGVMHYCSGDVINQAELGELLIQLMMQNQLLRSDVNIERVNVSPDDMPSSAVVGSRRIRDCFGIQARSWRPQILALVKQWVGSRVDPTPALLLPGEGV